ncbi:MAG TPA: ABC transporter ATP-binding protein [Saprospiraceae bacterium]|nr:ABC transporter ATP-binding protein [Saprospiraceae bacterium]
MKHLRTLNRFFIRYRWRILLGIVFVALSNYFRAWQPQVIREALDHVLEQVRIYKDAPVPQQQLIMDELSKALFQFGGIVIVLAILMGVFMYLMRQTIIVMSRLIEYDMRKEIFDQYQKLDLAFYRQHNTGDLMSRITEDVSRVRMYLGPAILYGINLATLFVLVIYSMLSVNVELTLYTLLPLPLLSLSIYYVSDLIHKRSGARQTQLAKLTSTVQEVFSGIRIVKSYAQERRFGEHFARQCDQYKQKNLEIARVEAFFFPLMMILIGASTLLVVFVGGLQVSRGEVTPGNIAEFVIYVNMLTWPVTSIGWIASLIQQAEASQQRINEFMQRKPVISTPIISSEVLKGNIEFRNVSFTYPDTGIRALHNVSFDIPAGSRVALVGRTASGKSSVADLLLRMYDVQEGQILIDGKDIREHDLDNLRYRIGYVPQDVFLFSDTVTNNILFGSHVEDRQIAMDYARNAAIHEEIMELTNGYDTMIGERGVTLSGGQKQRISIARAFVKNPDILILDDCLSAVDTKTERRIFDYLDTALHKKTSIIITHRMLGAADFDRIFVLDHGQIVESGTHEDLMDRQGVYYDLIVHPTIEQEA